MGLIKIVSFVGIVSILNQGIQPQRSNGVIHKHFIRITEVSVENPLPHPSPIYEDDEVVARSRSPHEEVN